MQLQNIHVFKRNVAGMYGIGKESKIETGIITWSLLSLSLRAPRD